MRCMLLLHRNIYAIISIPPIPSSGSSDRCFPPSRRHLRCFHDRCCGRIQSVQDTHQVDQSRESHEVLTFLTFKQLYKLTMDGIAVEFSITIFQVENITILAPGKFLFRCVRIT